MQHHESDETTHGAAQVSRRSLLRYVGLGALGIGFGGIGTAGAPAAYGARKETDGTSGGAGSIQRPDISFARSVTLDVSEGQNIDAALKEAVADDTLVRIPKGTYEVAQTLEMPEKAGIEGVGDVTLTVPAEKSFFHINADSRVLHLRNLHYDLSADNNATGVKAYVSEKGYVGDISITGRAEADDVPPGLALAARRKDAVLLVERYVDIGRGTGSHTGERGGNGRMAIWSGNGRHEGLCILHDCRVIDSANNAIYATNLGKAGRFHVRGGIFKHNYGAGVRTGGNGSIIENCYIEVDMRESKRDWWGGQPAIRWEVKDKVATPTSAGVIRNCDIRMIRGKMAQGIRLQRSAARVKVENCRVQIEEEQTTPLAVYGIGEDEYLYPPPDEDTRVEINGLHVTGSAARQTPSITIGEGRDGSLVRNCYIPGGIESKSNIITRNNHKQMGKPPRVPKAARE